MHIADFKRDFYKKLFEVAPEEVHREITKQQKAVKNTLFTVMGGHDRIVAELAVKFQERFHVRIDQMASDYRTWKRAGCKPYAKPKQFVSGKVAGASKKAFDQVLGAYLLSVREPKIESPTLEVINTNRDSDIKDDQPWDEFAA